MSCPLLRRAATIKQKILSVYRTKCGCDTDSLLSRCCKDSRK